MHQQPFEVFLHDPDSYLPEECRPWVRRVRSGDLSDLPDDPTEDELAAISLAFDGYRVAEQLGRYKPDLLAWANARLQAKERTGRLPDSSLDLWLILFALQPGWRIITGSGPAGADYLATWRAVYLAWREALRNGRDSAEVTYSPGDGHI